MGNHASGCSQIQGNLTGNAGGNPEPSLDFLSRKVQRLDGNIP